MGGEKTLKEMQKARTGDCYGLFFIFLSFPHCLSGNPDLKNNIRRD